MFSFVNGERSLGERERLVMLEFRALSIVSVAVDVGRFLTIMRRRTISGASYLQVSSKLVSLRKTSPYCIIYTYLTLTRYIEGIPILYQTNTLSFRCPRDIVFFQAQVEAFSKLAQAVDLHCAKTSSRDELLHHNAAYHPWALPRGQFDAYFEMMWLDKDLAVSARHVRLYFETAETGDFYVAFNVRTLLRSDVVPAAQIQVFLQGNSNSMVDESIKLTSTPDKRRRITVNANTKVSECHGEISDED